MATNISIQKKQQSNAENRLFSILIPSWNNLSYLKLCVDSIRNNSHFKHQVIIHVNEGKDGTLAWIATQPDLDYTFSENNIGICYALNAARTLALTDYIVYMNDDMYACPNWDFELINEIKKIGRTDFFLSATMIEPYAGNSCVIHNDFGTDIKTFREKDLLEKVPSISFHDWQGATWPPNIVHKDVWDMVGGYSIEFSPGMYSDPDFSMKLWQAGVRYFKGLGASRVYHFGKKSTTRISKTKTHYTFTKKWGITSGAFTKYFLRRGEIFDGSLQEPVLPFSIKIKNFIKKLDAFFH